MARLFHQPLKQPLHPLRTQRCEHPPPEPGKPGPKHPILLGALLQVLRQLRKLLLILFGVQSGLLIDGHGPLEVHDVVRELRTHAALHMQLLHGRNLLFMIGHPRQCFEAFLLTIIQHQGGAQGLAHRAVRHATEQTLNDGQAFLRTVVRLLEDLIELGLEVFDPLLDGGLHLFNRPRLIGHMVPKIGQPLTHIELGKILILAHQAAEFRRHVCPGKSL